MSISISDVQALVPVDSSVITESLLQSYIDIVTQIADEDLEYIFQDPLPAVTEADCKNYSSDNTNGSDFIKVNAWQETGLTIKFTGIENSHNPVLTETALTLGSDYVLHYGKTGSKIPGKSTPVTAIKLLNRKLYPNQILRLSGTYGWATKYPTALKTILCNIVLSLSAYANELAANDGMGGNMRIKSMTVEKEISEEMAKELEARARNIYADPDYQYIIGRYKLFTEQSITFL